MPEILTVGEILVEVMTKNIGQTFLEYGDLIGPYASGAPAIFIDQAAQMGGDCGIVSKVGKDDFGRLNIDRLKHDGVDVSRIIESCEYTTGTAFVTYFKDGSRQFIFHFRHSASGFLMPDEIDLKYIKGCKYFHIMGCSLTASKHMRESVFLAAKTAKQNGAVISFDPNLRPELLEEEKVKHMFEELLGMTDILLSGESEITALTAEQDIEATIEKLHTSGVKTIILKNGSKGIKVLHEGERQTVLPLMVDEVDPTGAGDCFDGAFIALISKGYDVFEAAAIANAAGALSVTKKGPMEGVHFADEVMGFYKKTKNMEKK